MPGIYDGARQAMERQHQLVLGQAQNMRNHWEGQRQFDLNRQDTMREASLNRLQDYQRMGQQQDQFDRRADQVDRSFDRGVVESDRSFDENQRRYGVEQAKEDEATTFERGMDVAQEARMKQQAEESSRHNKRMEANYEERTDLYQRRDERDHQAGIDAFQNSINERMAQQEQASIQRMQHVQAMGQAAADLGVSPEQLDQWHQSGLLEKFRDPDQMRRHLDDAMGREERGEDPLVNAKTMEFDVLIDEIGDRITDINKQVRDGSSLGMTNDDRENLWQKRGKLMSAKSALESLKGAVRASSDPMSLSEYEAATGDTAIADIIKSAAQVLAKGVYGDHEPEGATVQRVFMDLMQRAGWQQ